MAQPPPLETPQRSAWRLRAGIACWLVQPLYLVLELVVAAVASSAYSLRDDTISTLGQVRCVLGEGGAVVGVCSSGHATMNAGFVVFGLLRAIGALLLRDHFRPTMWRTAATSLWVGSGIFSAAVGLAPVDQYPAVHALVATPIFVLQPLAILATVVAVGRGPEAPRGVRSTGLVAGALSVIGSLAFGARLGQPTWSGAVERLALWPAYLWLGLLAAALLAPILFAPGRLAATVRADGRRSRR